MFWRKRSKDTKDANRKATTAKATRYLAKSDQIMAGLAHNDPQAIAAARRYLINLATLGDAHELGLFLMVAHTLAEAHVRGLIDEGDHIEVAVEVRRKRR